MKVLPPYYGSEYIMRKPATCQGMLHVDLWRFKSLKSGKLYLVEVEVYENHVYGIKFYLKSQAHKASRYSYKTNDFEPRRIVLTCLHIMKHYYEIDPQSSFTFIGENCKGEGRQCTKRFRLYRTMVNTYFGTQTFEHREDVEISAYLMLRKSELVNGNLSLSVIEDFFRRIYVF